MMMTMMGCSRGGGSGWAAASGAVVVLVAVLTVFAPPTTAALTVHVVQTCHLDVGFAETAAGELDNYRRYLVEAQNISEALKTMKNPDNAGLIFTTHPYVVSLLLDCPPGMGFTCPTEQERATIIAGLKQGNIVMQAFPHNSETATMSTELFVAGLQLGKRLARDLNISAPTVMTQRDVPGATRGMIPLLASAGVRGFSVGVNTASLPPAVPRVFVWRDEASNTDVLASLHPHGYGGIDKSDCIVIDGFDHVLCPDYKGDNEGPWSVIEVLQHWKQLKKEFPGATIVPSSFDSYFEILESVKHRLPVITQEIADTWIYGIASDPYKNTAYRALERARVSCLGSGACSAADAVMLNFTRLLLKNPEHTWGGDVKKYLHDEDNWLNVDFHRLQYSADNYVQIASMWQEQRDWGLKFARQAVPTSHPLTSFISDELAGTSPQLPSLSGYSQVADVTKEMRVGGFVVSFNATTGAIASLVHASSETVLASTANQIGTFEYKVHAASEYETFFDEYAQRIDGKIPSYFPKDFGKPGLYNNSIIANTTIVHAPIKAAFVKNDSQAASVVLQLQPPNIAHLRANFGPPDSVWIEYSFDSSRVNISLLLSNKTATRLPESAWFKFAPRVSSSGWTMGKLADANVNPLDVAVNGSRHLHAVWDGVRHSSGVSLRTLDAPLLSWGDTNPFPTPSGDWQPDVSRGVNFCLFNNIWGTNYIMWVPFRKDEHSYKYRFQLSLQQQQQ
ncbi:hypothetical protein PTSG_09435 [Salpingoeca rosetta]|uniref:Glycoside hydrolase family 38 N-terminal domain-containing protein n=1 Tax=Salpingoeca rosetta (strain ATCC 50818 / BSB-021) TaxID=946362 RepID=F2UML9_SALR5|nr:uncharacterized protein PTSG_09435 [Salpingoeca rosetta]EGD78368.1 hypothetical protein PTSG_09435 [Salpingoeca rosetta]|eukprot:XP_004989691.1 hypothetical protein PTSG_09435 [Salpingoeca rosetta]